MNIICEGADNSGKTTLVNYLAAATGMTYVPGEGPPKSTKEINERVERYLKMDNVIFDRHPCVSNGMYDRYRNDQMPVRPDLIKKFYDANPLFIYCVADPSLDTHEVKGADHESEEHVDMVKEHHLGIIALYDSWAQDHANWLYRKGRTDMANIAFLIKAIQAEHRNPDLLTDLVGDVAVFHDRFNLPQTRAIVQALPEDQRKFREKFMDEELQEYKDAGAIIADKAAFDQEQYTQVLEDQLDALVDLVYVAIGTALFHGFDFRTAWRRVQAANMAKVRAVHESDSKRGSTFDVVKPEGWLPPSHTDLVANNDFEEHFPNA